MKIRITFEADDELREAINRHYGRSGKASYKDIKSWFERYGTSANDDIVDELAANKAKGGE